MICDLAFLRLETLQNPDDRNTQTRFFLTPTGQKNLNFFHAFAKQRTEIAETLTLSMDITYSHTTRTKSTQIFLPELPKLLFSLQGVASRHDPIL